MPFRPMIDPDNFYIVVRAAAVFGTGLTEAEVRRRLCALKSPGQKAPDFYPGQATTIEDDGRVRWTVTRSSRRAPDGKKLVAFVVASERYAAEAVPRRERLRRMA